jgi:hypothetical protein
MLMVFAETLDNYIDRLRDEHKIPEIGIGAFSFVFQHPEDSKIAIKISIDDPEYMRFARFCVAQKTNRWLPHVQLITQLHLENVAEAWAVFLPRLTPAAETQIRNAFTNQIAPWISDLNRFSEITRLSFPEWRNVLRTTEDPDLRVVARFMIQKFNRLDLTTQNFMMRDKQLVFNDPIAKRLSYK